MAKKDIAFIIINFNTSHFTLDCVHSIIAKTPEHISYQIIIVDNNSRVEEYEKLIYLREMPQVILFRSRVNGGFSLGNMMGVQFANARYYYFLNNDTILLNEVPQILMEFMDNHPDVGICSGQMYDKDGQHYLNFNYFPGLGLKLFGVGFMRIFGEYPHRRKIYDKPLKVDLVNGSSMFVRAEVFDKIGGFDTNLFLYCEEEDIARRFKAQGYSCWLVPAARYQHFISQSTNPDGKINFPLLKEFYISYLYYFRKHHSWLYTKAMQLYLFFKFLKKPRYWKMVPFIASGAPMKESLRHRQSLGKR